MLPSLCTIVETATLNGLDPEANLRAIITHIARYGSAPRPQLRSSIAAQ